MPGPCSLFTAPKKIDSELSEAALLIAAHDEGYRPPLLGDFSEHISDRVNLLRLALSGDGALAGLAAKGIKICASQLKTLLTFRCELLLPPFDTELVNSVCTETDLVQSWRERLRAWNGPWRPYTDDGTHVTNVDAPEKVWIVGASGAGKSMLGCSLASAGVPVFDFDQMLSSSEVISHGVSLDGISAMVRRAEAVFREGISSGTQVADLGALFLLSPTVRRTLRRVRGHVIALDGSTELLAARAFQPSHEIGLNYTFDPELHTDTFWLRRAMALSVATELLDASLSISSLHDSVAPAMELMSNNAGHLKDNFPEFEKQSYFPGISGLLDGYLTCYTPSPLSLLDIGAGSGRNLHYIMIRFPRCQAVAVEPSDSGLQQLVHNARLFGYSWRLLAIADVAEKAFSSLRECTFDTILAMTTLSHIDRRAFPGISSFLSGALSRGGYLLTSVFLEGDPGNSERESLETGHASPTSRHVRSYFRAGELVEILHRLEVKSYSEFSFLDTSHGRPHRHAVGEAIFRQHGGC
ncbi:bifunctional 2-polyprenyl-6-hydroxyphenol methylase/3-demethylubiquinol 3-O-methyltransferase UbiG [Arachnia propionica]|uniref:Class I SAM-dependent methyltransferase n=1 Tax=Arachnia propionica TaxID=1750 RepID=A0A3P1WWA4_9ACTN|nr:class I SAM-dependent methyltransferase [Arachnia propionica]RRD50198.1 class I SAM-dependent methyltransferase [Arachnia propionica]